MKDDPLNRFYIPCLREAAKYRRAVGYFRSSVFVVIGPAIVEFARRGGKIELICSPDLDESDVEQIENGYRLRSASVATSLIQQFDALLADDRTAYAARVLASLIAVGSLEIKLAERRDGKGIYHEKIGVFTDVRGNAVSFKGSTNETWKGWHSSGNFESIEVFCSWRGGLEKKRVERHADHFESLWSENDPHVTVLPVPEEFRVHVRRFAAKRLIELDDNSPASTATTRVPLPHQLTAIEGWNENGRRGIFEHATGSGKTFTAIIALRQHLETGNPALVLVPSQLLLEQWAKELAEEIPSAALLLAGGGNNRWKATRRLESMTAPDVELGPRITLAIMDSASGDEFRKRIQQGHHLLVVADEVHRMGSPGNSRIMEVEAGARLGLSATPKRYGDPDGTKRIFDYFGPVIEPPMTLADAVKAERLVPYEYYPHPINLTASEAEDWRARTQAIRFEIARQKTDSQGRKVLSERAKMMLIQRSRIAKKAAAKVTLAVQVLRQNFESEQSWLVYCEDSEQLHDVLEALKTAGMAAVEYHSNMAGDREATMNWFRSFGGILVSIRCLDEGVDIPAVSHALILASSQNPRQFIQRRGRVLRKAPGKALAVIHDAIVVPVDPEEESDQLGLLKAELLRSVEFADNALNRMAGAELREIAIRMGISPDSLSAEDGGEEEEEYE
ncbi:MAG: DEAD/DEAH box helicase family protein [Verrucomicrobiota bacterium]